MTHAYRRSRDQHQKDKVDEKQEEAAKEEMPVAAEKSDNHNNSLEYSESEQLQFSQPPKESQFHPGDVHNSEPLPYIDEERESRSGLRQSLKAEPMDDEYNEDGDDGEEDDEIDAFEPEVEIIEPKKKRKKTRKVLQSQPLKP